MSNPFIELGSPMLEQQRRRARHFQIGVYTVLVTMTVFLLGMLIQGCNSEPPAAEAPSQSAADATASSSNAPAVVAEQPATNAPVPEPNPVVVPPSVEPAKPVAMIVPPPAVTNQAPVPTSKASTQTPGIYVVKSGDTLQRIAKAHGTTVKALRAANKLKSDRITVGRKLKLPRGVAAVPVV